jgi:hypothetical protein
MLGFYRQTFLEITKVVEAYLLTYVRTYLLTIAYKQKETIHI